MTAAHPDVHTEVLHDRHQAGHGTFKSYMTGFVLAVALTAIPFWLVMGHVVTNSRILAFIIMGLAGVQVVVLLALTDEGAPEFDRAQAGVLAALGVPAFACTPDAFPELLAVALSRGDVRAWHERNQAAAR